MKALFIGGTGIISSACSDLAVERNIELYHLNRGQSSTIRKPPKGISQINANVRNREQTLQALSQLKFDVVVDFISFVPEQLHTNLEIFSGKCTQYLFISSASAYQTPPLKLPVVEETPLENPFWQYSREKAACERLLIEMAATKGMKYTIVRPSHTYDKTTIPVLGGYTSINRMKNNKPVLVLGDGTSIWTLTHHKDFAKGLIGLLGNSLAMDETFHITSDEWITWNRIYELAGKAFGYSPKIVHVPSDRIAQYNAEMGENFLGDKSHSMIFDNSKIKRVVPEFNCDISFEQGVREIAEWYTAESSRQLINAEFEKDIDRIINDWS